MKRNLLYIFIVCAMCLPKLDAQKLVESEEIAALSAALINFQVGAFGLDPAANGIIAYKIRYNTIDAMGNPTIASGLITIPDVSDNGSINDLSMIVYNHGTTDRASVASQGIQGSGFFEAAYIAARGGAMGVAPDYIGLGDSEGFHPYIHEDSQASAGLDLMLAAQEFAEEIEASFNSNLFITGYSQGGHASMALHKLLETSYPDEFPVTAAAHLSGPYSVKKVMAERMIDDLDYVPGIGFLPYVVIGMNEAYGNLYTDLNEIFLDEYIAPIEAFSNTGVGLTDMLDELQGILMANTGTSNPKLMLQQSTIDAVANLSEDNPIGFALIDNDLTDWVPQAPTRLFYCEADEQVPYQNAIVADSIFNANGAPDVSSASQGADLDHGGCFFPAVTSTLEFFDSFIISNVEDNLSSTDIHISPNPADHFVNVEFGKSLDKDWNVQLVNTFGQKVNQIQKQQFNTYIRVDTQDITPGLYYLEISNKTEQYVEKIYIR